MRKYEFNWELLGDVSKGRPNMGGLVDLDMYRLMQFTLRDVLESKLGPEETDAIFYEAGKVAGRNFYEHYIQPVDTASDFVEKCQQQLKEKSVGILNVEEALLEEGRVLLTIDEDLDCAGLPELDYETCIYDEGFIAALFEGFTNENWMAREVDCWCTGAKTCRFLVTKEE